MADAGTTLTRLLTALSVSDPTWDTTVGSATYKIMESVAQEIANASNNSTLLTYGFDVTSYFGTELDAFVNLFGITRQLGTRSTGTVVFSTNTAASQNYTIPLGTQVYSPSSIYQSNIPFSTTSTAVMASGLTSIVVPVTSNLTGSFNNLAANTITQITTPLVGINAVTNQAAMANGTDTETDAQLQQRFLNTAFSNFAGTANKFLSIAQQNPAITQANVVQDQQNYLETLQVVTVISGNSNFNLGLQTQAQLIAVSGSTVASGYLGQLETNVAIPIASTTPLNIIAPGSTVSWDGTNYNLSSTVSGNGYLNIAYTYSGTLPVTLSGSTTASGISATISGLLNSTALNYGNTITVITSGSANTSSVASGLNITFSQSVPWNVVVTSGSVPATNTITSQIPDSKYCYPAGNELVGYNFNTIGQTLFTKNVDYNYIQVSGTPPLHLQITFNPGTMNAPFTYTGNSLQLQSEYIPISSRVITNSTVVNPNFVDIFINSTNIQSVTEQVVVITGNTIQASGSTSQYAASNFVLANNTIPPSGDYYVNFTQNPIANFPAQVISGSAPSFITFGSINFPINILPVTTTGPRALLSGTAGSTVLYTPTSLSGFTAGLVISGTLGNTSLSGIGTGNYIVSLQPGNPNIINMANPLTSNILASGSFVAVAYPVFDATNTAGSRLDATGVAVESVDPTGSFDGNYPSFPNNQIGTFSHAYYSDVVNVDNLAQQSRVVGTNVLAHQARFLNLAINLSIVYTPNANVGATNSSIQAAISNYLQEVPFDASVKLSSIISVAYNAAGVQSIRIATQADNPNAYGVQVVNLDGSVKQAYTKDILLANNQVPNLFALNFNIFGVNNF